MNCNIRFRSAAILLLTTVAPLTMSLGAQQTSNKYPVAPRGLPEADEIALAITAAPAEISANADVYVLRGTDFVKARGGTNGCACMVSRDLHGGSQYPICFDQEGARTSMLREMRESSLRAKGMSEAAVRSAVDTALASGALPMPRKVAVAYMMSPKQVLFSSPLADGVSVGRWSPHLMISAPGLTREQLGLPAKSKIGEFSLGEQRPGHPELIVKVQTWSDGTPVAAPAKR